MKIVDFMNVKWHCTFIIHTNYSLFKDKVILSANVFLGSYEEENQMLKMLGVEYIPYHACSNDCILYKGEYADKETCSQCG